MIRYAYDLYPRLDPRDGARIRRFEHLQEAAFKAEENGTGSGRAVIAGDSPDAEDIDPLLLQFVRVREINEGSVDGTTLSGFAEKVVDGWWLEKAKYEALTRRETKRLVLEGAGTLAYLQRAVMWSRTYIHAVFTGQDPIGTTWNLSAQSSFYAGGNHLGAMLWRVIYEAQHFQSGAYTHRHFDGVEHTGTHADDRTESAIPDLVMTFDQDLDSSGNAWTLTAGDFRAEVGESVLSVTRRLMELGLRVEMDPDTFELNAWEAPHRTDRTSATWAAGKVRFQAPTAEDIDTGNILSDAIRDIRAYIQRSVVLAGADNTYAISQGSSEPPWEGAYRLDTDETDTAAAVASRQRLARSDALDNLKIVGKPGDAEMEGRYRPWTHAFPGDLISVNTGADQWEYDEVTFPIAGITCELKEGSDWRVIYELGSSFSSMLEPAFRTGGAPAHSHAPNPPLCTTTLTTGETATLYEEWTWEAGNESEANPGTLALGPGTDVWGEGASTSGGGAEGTTYASPLNHDNGSRDIAAVAGTVYRFTGYFNPFNTDVRMEVRWFTAAGTLISTQTLFYDNFWPAGWNAWSSADITAPPTAANMQLRSRTGASGGVGTTGHVDQVRIYTITSGITGGGTTDEYTGSSQFAARCDHNHDHNDLLNRNAEDAHAASAITADDPGDYFDGENVADQLQELAAMALAGSSQVWEAVTNGEDIFVWEDDDLVHEWRAV